jgi:hypothetical protein
MALNVNAMLRRNLASAGWPTPYQLFGQAGQTNQVAAPMANSPVVRVISSVSGRVIVLPTVAMGPGGPFIWIINDSANAVTVTNGVVPTGAAEWHSQRHAVDSCQPGSIVQPPAACADCRRRR